jgi:hypothetical protein
MKYGMNHNYVLLSALLLYAAFTIPIYCFFCVFLYLIPLFYHVITNNGVITGKEGVLWAIVFYGLHWYEVAILSQLHGEGMARYAVMPFLVIYSALYAGIWFWSASQLSAITKRPALIWIFMTWIYIIFMQRVAFWILGRVQGYPFSFPLIPLAQHPQLLHALQYLHPHMLLFMLIAGSWYAAAALHSQTSKERALALACYVPFLVGILQIGGDHNNALPVRYSTYGYVSPASLPNHPLERVGKLAQCCNVLVKKNPCITHILTPESTLTIPFNVNQAAFEALTHNLSDQTLTIILGSQRKKGEEYYNCCYFLHNRLIIQGYDKSLMMPYTEYLPNNWLNVEGINRIFLHNKRVMIGSRKESDFDFGQNFNLMPKICSDYYLDWYDEPQQTKIPLLLMVNETWFEGKVMRHLMQLTARYGALARRQDIIYVGYAEGIYFSRDGRGWPLLQ